MIVVVAALGAQLFAYAFDSTTSFFPPRGHHWADYYLNPLAGPKTLYGAIVLLPVGVALARLGWRKPGFVQTLDRCTPALLLIIAMARVGCLLQGCCYGVCAPRFGVHFPTGSAVYYHHLHQGWLEAGQRSLAVVPTQAISAAVLLALSAWAYRGVRGGGAHVFAHSIALYSAYRLLIEFVRDDAVRNAVGPLSTSQWIACVILAAYAAWSVVRNRIRGAALS